MKFKPAFYYFLIMLILLNAKAITFHNTHLFSLMIIMVSILLILMSRLRVLEEDGPKSRHIILGFVCAQGVYYMENFLMN